MRCDSSAGPGFCGKLTNIVGLGRFLASSESLSSDPLRRGSHGHRGSCGHHGSRGRLRLRWIPRALISAANELKRCACPSNLSVKKCRIPRYSALFCNVLRFGDGPQGPRCPGSRCPRQNKGKKSPSRRINESALYHSGDV